MSECKHKFISTNRIFCTHCEFEPSDDYVLLLKQLKDAQADIQTQKANLLSQGRLLVEARDEVERLKACPICFRAYCRCKKIKKGEE